ncbi:Mrp/NBP35 family ATP-binding protein [Coprothermobacteraceae bacterium]|nr:Mrp/NBP35 family ATP-binding protein [Coprothermobacteraceae bacterium]
MAEPVPNVGKFVVQKNGNEHSNIKNVVAVVSGKGGVGKSTVSALLAVALRRQGWKVGILDADLTGASIPYLFGLKTAKLGVSEKGLEPAVSTLGIKVVSIALVMDNPENAVVWRGPLLSKAIEQFWSDVHWGELDYLVVDMPPGTSDVPLTVMQKLPLKGVVVVTSPQEMARSVVKKAVHMAELLKVPVLGVIENMSYAVCPNCGHRFAVFGPSHLEEVAVEFGTPVIAQIPIDPVLAELTDAGRIEDATPSMLDNLVGVLGKIHKEE